MALTHRLDLRQTQALVMTPQLQQAIKLLQLGALELADYVTAELEQNPLLERAEAADMPERSNGAAEPEAPQQTDESETWNGAEGPDQFADWGAGGRSDFDEGGGAIEDTLKREVSLRDHLLGQVAMDLADPADRVIGAHLVDMIDEAGYLAGDLGAVAEKLGCDAARVAATLAKMQGFDPPGVFARNLSECLALQLRDRDRCDPAMQALVQNLELVARRDHKALMKLCGVDAEDLAEMMAEIRSLNPKPGLAFDQAVAQPIVPDVIMRALPKGGALFISIANPGGEICPASWPP